MPSLVRLSIYALAPPHAAKYPALHVRAFRSVLARAPMEMWIRQQYVTRARASLDERALRHRSRWVAMPLRS